ICTVGGSMEGRGSLWPCVPPSVAPDCIAERASLNIARWQPGTSLARLSDGRIHVHELASWRYLPVIAHRLARRALGLLPWTRADHVRSAMAPKIEVQSTAACGNLALSASSIQSSLAPVALCAREIILFGEAVSSGNATETFLRCD